MKRMLILAAFVALIAAGCKSGCDDCCVDPGAEFPTVERWWK